MQFGGKSYCAWQASYLFRKCRNYFVRLNWHDEVLFPTRPPRVIAYISAMQCAVWKNKDVEGLFLTVTWWTTISKQYVTERSNTDITYCRICSGKF